MGKLSAIFGSDLGTITQDDYPNLPSTASIPGWFRIANPADWEEELSLIPTSTTGTFSTYPYLLRQSTSAISKDVEMEQLSRATHQGDEKHFVVLANQIDWASRDADQILIGIRYALNLGLHLKARKLAELGGERYPEHAELQKATRILAEPSVKSTPKPADPNAKADMQWFKSNGDKYRGQWVALRRGVLLAVGPTSNELLNSLENPRDKSILITLVY